MIPLIILSVCILITTYSFIRHDYNTSELIRIGSNMVAVTTILLVYFEYIIIPASLLTSWMIVLAIFLGMAIANMVLNLRKLSNQE